MKWRIIISEDGDSLQIEPEMIKTEIIMIIIKIIRALTLEKKMQNQYFTFEVKFNL